MAFLTSIASNPDAERDGVWAPYIDGIYLRVARMWNPRYDERVATLTVESTEAFGPTITPEIRNDIQRDAAADVLLTDWACVDGILDDDLNPVETEPLSEDHVDKPDEARCVDIPKMPGMVGPVKVMERRVNGLWYRDLGDQWLQIVRYNPELGRRIFADPRYRDMYMFVQTISNQSRRYRETALRAMAGN